MAQVQHPVFAVGLCKFTFPTAGVLADLPAEHRAEDTRRALLVGRPVERVDQLYEHFVFVQLVLHRRLARRRPALGQLHRRGKILIVPLLGCRALIHRPLRQKHPHKTKPPVFGIGRRLDGHHEVVPRTKNRQLRPHAAGLRRLKFCLVRLAQIPHYAPRLFLLHVRQKHQYQFRRGIFLFRILDHLRRAGE